MIKVRASNCEIRDVTNEKDFLECNHYQGYVPSTWCKGLYYNNELVCLMSFGAPRYNHRYDWELLRLCTKKDYQVFGGASKLFKEFINNSNGSILSYCNKSRFTGKVYEALGFNSLGTCKSYHYEKDGKRYHRSNFMKCKLLKKYPECNPKLTEKEIMQRLGYTRVDEVEETFVYGVEWYIYQITNNVNGKTYIGQHLDRGDYYMGSGTSLKRAIDKYGIENFTKDILASHIKTQKEADALEKKYIAEAKAIGKCEYNIQEGGRRGYYVSHISPSTWQKGHTPWNKGKKCKPQSGESNKKRSETMKGKAPAYKRTDEIKAKNYSEERNAKIAAAKRGKKRGSWYTNGISNCLIKENDSIPDGYYKGFTSSK